MEYFTYELEKLYENEELISSLFIDPYNFTRFSHMKNLNKITKIIKNDNTNNKDFSYLKNHTNIQKLGFYILPKSASPGFKNFRKIVNTLKKKFNLYLFIDDSKTNMDASDLSFFDDVNEIMDEETVESSKVIFLTVYF